MPEPARPLPRVRGVIFDMDGTLADSLSHYYRIACDIIERAGAPPVPRERILELMGTGDPDLLRKLLPEHFPASDETLARIVRERYPAWLRAGERIQPLPGCLDLLHQLHADGRKLGIATASNRALPYLDHWGVRDLFDAIVGREDVTRRKPHPEALLCCLEKLGVGPAEAVYLGDSPIDIDAGKAAGLYTIGVLTGTGSRAALAARSPDHILAGAPGLLSLLPP